MTLVVSDESGQAICRLPRSYWGDHLPAWASNAKVPPFTHTPSHQRLELNSAGASS